MSPPGTKVPNDGPNAFFSNPPVRGFGFESENVYPGYDLLKLIKVLTVLKTSLGSIVFGGVTQPTFGTSSPVVLLCFIIHGTKTLPGVHLPLGSNTAIPYLFTGPLAFFLCGLLSALGFVFELSAFTDSEAEKSTESF